MRPIAKHGVVWSVCPLVTFMCLKNGTAAPIKMPLGLVTQVGPGNHVLNVNAHDPGERAFFLGGE